MHKADTPVYLLIRRRICCSIYATDSQNQLRIDSQKTLSDLKMQYRGRRWGDFAS